MPRRIGSRDDDDRYLRDQCHVPGHASDPGPAVFPHHRGNTADGELSHVQDDDVVGAVPNRGMNHVNGWINMPWWLIEHEIDDQQEPGGHGGPRWHQGGPGCWSRPPLTASWPSLLLSATGFNSNAALPDVVLTATGKACCCQNGPLTATGRATMLTPPGRRRSGAQRTSARERRSAAKALVHKSQGGKASQLTPPGAWLFTVPGHPAASPGTGDRP